MEFKIGGYLLTRRSRGIMGYELEDLLDLIPVLGGDPLVSYMKEKGYDPNKGDVLIIPYKFRAQLDWGTCGKPHYVKYAMVDDVFLVKAGGIVFGEIV